MSSDFPLTSDFTANLASDRAIFNQGRLILRRRIRRYGEQAERVDGLLDASHDLVSSATALYQSHLAYALHLRKPVPATASALFSAASTAHAATVAASGFAAEYLSRKADAPDREAAREDFAAASRNAIALLLDVPKA